jgi:uncharacterized protein YjiS (DUF1127 family)
MSGHPADREIRAVACERSYQESIKMAISNLFKNLREWYRRTAVRQRLLGLDDRVLADIGVSRELLDLGVRAWPWQVPSEDRLRLSAMTLGSGSVMSSQSVEFAEPEENNRARTTQDLSKDVADRPWAA